MREFNAIVIAQSIIGAGEKTLEPDELWSG
jgi:hypothetical protein